MGIFTNTGQLISVSGSAGCVLGYAMSAFIVTAVMRSLAEMVSVRPFSGALIDFPATFVDPALGFAVGVIYWYIYTLCFCCFLLFETVMPRALRYQGKKAIKGLGLTV